MPPRECGCPRGIPANPSALIMHVHAAQLHVEQVRVCDQNDEWPNRARRSIRRPSAGSHWLAARRRIQALAS